MADHRRVTALLVLCVVVLSACAGTVRQEAANPDELASPGAGGAAADVAASIRLESFEGHDVTLRDYAGTPLVVNFWASWCPPCVAEMPDFEAVHRSVVGQVEFLGVNTQDTPEQAAALARRTGVTYDLVRDPHGELFRAVGVFGMPSTIYVAADGNVVARHTGLLTRSALADDLRTHFGVEVDEAP